MHIEDIDKSPKLYTYKLTDDTGFAPNPFWGVLTLATCKPGMRRHRSVGEWIAGFTSVDLCGDPVGEERLIYLMQVWRKITIADYFLDPAYARKIPNIESPRWVERVGDNIYRPMRNPAWDPSDFGQLPNLFHADPCGGCGVGDHHRDDISGQFVLLAKRFVYFGGRPLSIPTEFRPRLPIRQSPYGVFSEDTALAARFIAYALSQADARRVLHAPMCQWPSGDDSWREGANDLGD